MGAIKRIAINDPRLAPSNANGVYYPGTLEISLNTTGVESNIAKAFTEIGIAQNVLSNGYNSKLQDIIVAYLYDVITNMGIISF